MSEVPVVVPPDKTPGVGGLPAPRVVHPATGEVLDLDRPSDDLASFLFSAREFEWKLREAKKVVGNELLSRMDADASWTLRVGGYEVVGESPAPKVDWDAELLHRILCGLVDDGEITEAAVEAAVEEVVTLKAKPSGINKLLKRGGEIAERILRAKTEVEKDRRIKRVEKLG